MNILIIGGNRFFGKKLAQNLLRKGHDVTLLNRGSIEDGFGNSIKRLKCDRKDIESLRNQTSNKSWDVVYDQVCFDANEASDALDIFRNKTQHYIFTSSQSVYSPGSNLKEEAYDPRTHKFIEVAEKDKNYAEAKRQCEAVLFQAKDFPVTAVRFPIVLGRDDYTKRFQFHIEKIQKGEPLYFPNLEAQISFILSDDAALALEHIAGLGPQGPINAASSKPIVLADFLREISHVVGRDPLFAESTDVKNRSPYGIKSNWFMNVQKLSSLGYEARPIQTWLREEAIALTCAL